MRKITNRAKEIFEASFYENYRAVKDFGIGYIDIGNLIYDGLLNTRVLNDIQILIDSRAKENRMMLKYDVINKTKYQNTKETLRLTQTGLDKAIKICEELK